MGDVAKAVEDGRPDAEAVLRAAEGRRARGAGVGYGPSLALLVLPFLPMS